MALLLRLRKSKRSEDLAHVLYVYSTIFSSIIYFPTVKHPCQWTIILVLSFWKDFEKAKLMNLYFQYQHFY